MVERELLGDGVCNLDKHRKAPNAVGHSLCRHIAGGERRSKGRWLRVSREYPLENFGGSPHGLESSRSGC